MAGSVYTGRVYDSEGSCDTHTSCMMIPLLHLSIQLPSHMCDNSPWDLASSMRSIADSGLASARYPGRQVRNYVIACPRAGWPEFSATSLISFVFTA